MSSPSELLFVVVTFLAVTGCAACAGLGICPPWVTHVGVGIGLPCRFGVAVDLCLLVFLGVVGFTVGASFSDGADATILPGYLSRLLYLLC